MEGVVTADTIPRWLHHKVQSVKTEYGGSCHGWYHSQVTGTAWRTSKHCLNLWWCRTTWIRQVSTKLSQDHHKRSQLFLEEFTNYSYMLAYVSQWLQSLSNRCEVKTVAGLLLLCLSLLNEPHSHMSWFLWCGVWGESSCYIYTSGGNLQQLPSNMMGKNPKLENVTSLCKTNHGNNSYTFQDCLAHLGLRTGKRYLRIPSKKQMAALFTAFDSLCCEKLNGQHIDAHAKPVLNALQCGGFCMPTKW